MLSVAPVLADDFMNFVRSSVVLSLTSGMQVPGSAADGSKLTA